jgi:hypothetical protein
MSTALKKSPLARVKDEFGGKDKLVDKIVGVLGSSADESKDEVRKRLLGVANRKLIRLYSVATRTKEAGGHDELAQAAANGLNRGKDKDYVTRLGDYSNGRLLDMLGSSQARKAAAAAPVGAEKSAVAKKARAAKPAKAGKTAAAAPAGSAKSAVAAAAKKARAAKPAKASVEKKVAKPARGASKPAAKSKSKKR